MRDDAKNWVSKIVPEVLTRRYFLLIGIIIGSLLTALTVYLNIDTVRQFVAGKRNERRTRKHLKLPPLPLPEHPRIDERREAYLQPGALPELLKTYKRAGNFLPIILAILDEYQLPPHLVYLPILESRFLPGSYSHAGATGLWQLMPSVATRYGLRNDRLVDERRDPEKATVAAAEYLRFLYEEFGRWDLALAAYNCGPAKLREVMAKEDSENFWRLRLLPQETQAYVPSFYAILQIMTESEKYGVELPEIQSPLNFEIIEVEEAFTITEIARLADISTDDIREYNPALIGNHTPSGAYPVRVPKGAKSRFMKQYREMLLANLANGKSNAGKVEFLYRVEREGLALTTLSRYYLVSEEDIRLWNPWLNSQRLQHGEELRIFKSFADVEVYRTRKGDTLARIAKRFGTSVPNLKRWNQLQSSRIYPGRNLIVNLGDSS